VDARDSAPSVPGNDQRLPSRETGQVIPAQPAASVELDAASLPAVTYVPYQAAGAEQTSDSLPTYANAGEAEDWNQQYDASSNMQRYLLMTSGYYDSSRTAVENIAEGMPARTGGLAVSTGLVASSPARGISSSALRQPAASTPGSGKKTVTFHENIATEYAIHQSYGSTSSDSSFVALSPPEMSVGPDSAMYQGGPFYGYGSAVPR